MNGQADVRTSYPVFYRIITPFEAAAQKFRFFFVQWTQEGTKLGGNLIRPADGPTQRGIEKLARE